MTQVRTLESQMFPNKKGYLLQSFKDATSKPFHPLLLDLKPDTPDHLRVRGRVLDPNSQDVYLPREYKFNPYDPNDSLSL